MSITILGTCTLCILTDFKKTHEHFTVALVRGDAACTGPDHRSFDEVALSLMVATQKPRPQHGLPVVRYQEGVLVNESDWPR